MVKTVKQRSRKQEERIAREMGGKVTPGSGSVATAKGDVARTRWGFRVEAKYTDAKSFRLTKDVLEKIRREALSRGENWMIQLDFTRKPARRVAVLDYEVLLGLLEELDGDPNEE